jgi:hypothetical protein
MSITVRWGNEQRQFVLMTFSGEWSWGELHAREQVDLAALLAADSPPILMDLRGSIWRMTTGLNHQIAESGRIHAQAGVPLVIFSIADIGIGTLLVNAYRRYGSPDTRYCHETDYENARRGVLNHSLDL